MALSSVCFRRQDAGRCGQEPRTQARGRRSLRGGVLSKTSSKPPSVNMDAIRRNHLSVLHVAGGFHLPTVDEQTSRNETVKAWKVSREVLKLSMFLMLQQPGLRRNTPCLRRTAMHLEWMPRKCDVQHRYVCS